MGNLIRDIAPEQRDFFKVFEKIAYRHQYSEVFDDYLTMMLNWFADGVDETRQRRDQALAKYTPEEKQLFNVMMQEHMKVMHSRIVDHGEKWYDSLGDFYQTITSNYKSSAMGQFFTPDCICDMMATMNIGPEPYRTISDCACGSGRMLLAAHALQPLNFYHATDLDGMCVKMTILNFCLHNASGLVVHGNTLSMEVYQYYFIDRVQTEAGILPIVKLVTEKKANEIWWGITEFCRIMRKEQRPQLFNPEKMAEIVESFPSSIRETNDKPLTVMADVKLKPEQLTLF